MSLGKNGRAGLTPVQRLFVRFLDWSMTKQEGAPQPLSPYLVKTLGIPGFFRWVKSITEGLQLLETRYGKSLPQLLLGFAGLMTGCQYCGVCHVYTYNLMVYRDKGALFPLDETLVPQLQAMRDDDLLAELHTRLGSNPSFEEEHRLLQRMFELKLGIAEGTTPEDAHLQLAISMWEWVNQCSIELSMELTPEEIPPWGPMGRDLELLNRYLAARGKAPVSADTASAS
jgi:hypothetical protein